MPGIGARLMSKSAVARNVKKAVLRKRAIIDHAPRMKRGGFDRNGAECPQILLDLAACMRSEKMINEPGIFREPGVKTNVVELIQAYENIPPQRSSDDDSAAVDLAKYSSKDIASTFKQYLRNFEEPLLTYELASVFESLLDVDEDSLRAALLVRHIAQTDPTAVKSTRRERVSARENSQLLKRDPVADAALAVELLSQLTDDSREQLENEIRAERAAFVCENLPNGSRITAHCVFRLLYDTAQLSETNHMTPRNLAVCIGPSVYYTRSNDPNDMLASSHVSERLCTVMISHFPTVFPTKALSKAKQKMRLLLQPYNARVFRMVAKGMLALLRQDIKDAEKLEKLRLVSEKTGVPVEEIDLELYNRTLGRRTRESRHTTNLESDSANGASTHARPQHFGRSATQRHGIRSMTEAGAAIGAAHTQKVEAILTTDEIIIAVPTVGRSGISAVESPSPDVSLDIAPVAAAEEEEELPHLPRGEALAAWEVDDSLASKTDDDLLLTSGSDLGNPLFDADNDHESEPEERLFWDSDSDSYDDMDLPDIPSVSSPASKTSLLDVADAAATLDEIRAALRTMSFQSLKTTTKDTAAVVESSAPSDSAPSSSASTVDKRRGLMKAYREARKQREETSFLAEGSSIGRLHTTWKSFRDLQSTSSPSSADRARTFRDMQKMLVSVIAEVGSDDEAPALPFYGSSDEE